MNLSIITVTWNSASLIAEQMKSVMAGCTNISFEQIVVDNASTDNTVAIIEKDFPQVKLIKNNKNTGFAFPNNQAAKLAQGEFLLFLNPDMRVMPGSLDVMVEWMRSHPDVGIASPKLIDEFGKFNSASKPRRFPKLWEQIALIFKIPHIFPSLFKSYFYNDFDYNKEQAVDSVQGAFMIVRRGVYEKLGWAFDPRYFIWFEDVDLCREVQRLGFKVFYTPIISCVDYVGQSFKKRDTLWKQRQFTKSMQIYFQKWEPWYKWIWIALFRPFGIIMAWIKDSVYTLTGFNLHKLSRLEKDKKAGKL